MHPKFISKEFDEDLNNDKILPVHKTGKIERIGNSRGKKDTTPYNISPM